MQVIGLTGGIGSGKSTVARVFETFGIKIYNSDERAKTMYFIPKIKAEIEKLLGKEAYINQNTLNKKFIGEKIFSDSELLKQVNHIIHTAVKADFEVFCAENSSEKYIIKESALLIEANLLTSVDKLIVVTSPLLQRKKRIAMRDNLNETEINKRINQQFADEEKVKYAHWVLKNDESELLIPQIMAIHEELQK